MALPRDRSRSLTRQQNLDVINAHLSIKIHPTIFKHYDVLSLFKVMSVFVSVARLVLLAQSGDETHVSVALPFRLRASTDSSIDARRRPNIQQPLSKRRLSISVRGAPH